MLKLIDFQLFRGFSPFLKNNVSHGNLKLFDGKTIFWYKTWKKGLIIEVNYIKVCLFNR